MTCATRVSSDDEFWAARGDYTITLSGDIKDAAGNPLGADYVWTFKVGE